ncbi:MAG: nitroreductase family protein [Candidatus Woesearchaeota archaeon]
MNEITNLMEKRRSVRRFLTKSVEWGKIVNLLHAAKTAPSEGNLQAWKFIVTKDSKIIKDLAKASYKQMWINQAPYVIIVVGEVDKSEKNYEKGKFYNTLSCGACVQNILLKAKDLDLGACWVSAFDEEEISDILSIGSSKKPMALIPIGYPAEKPVKPRKEKLYDLVFINQWGQKVHDLDLKYKNYRYVEKTLTSFEKVIKWFNDLPNKIRDLFDSLKK